MRGNLVNSKFLLTFADEKNKQLLEIMKTKKELQKLSKAIDIATAKYNEAVLENLKECSDKEFSVGGDGEDNLLLTIDSLKGDNETIDVTIDKVRYNSKNGHVEMHFCEVGDKDADEWYQVSYFGYDLLPYVYDGIVWYG